MVGTRSAGSGGKACGAGAEDSRAMIIDIRDTNCLTVPTSVHPYLAYGKHESLHTCGSKHYEDEVQGRHNKKRILG